jgi:hypothetical protein
LGITRASAKQPVSFFFAELQKGWSRRPRKEAPRQVKGEKEKDKADNIPWTGLERVLRSKVVGQNLGGNRGGDQSRLSAAASHLSSGHFTRTEYNQLTIGIDDMRASDEGTKGSADQVVD